jgi:hypothetical protein
MSGRLGTEFMPAFAGEQITRSHHISVGFQQCCGNSFLIGHFVLNLSSSLLRFTFIDGT